MKQFYSHGKLLLTGEYAVLFGAKGLGLPCKKGQSLTYVPAKINTLSWKSFGDDGKLWFEGVYALPTLDCTATSDKEIAVRLQQLLKTIRELQPQFLKAEGGSVKTQLEFDRAWGLGSSSTLINNLALWVGVNPYELLQKTFGGSGYDIACAGSEQPLVYFLEDQKPNILPVHFDPVFKDSLFFVCRNQKQDSSVAVQEALQRKVPQSLMASVNQITSDIVQVQSQKKFNALLAAHEVLIASFLKTEPVQQKHFPDFNGQIKSLGAWGGDFMLASGDAQTPVYFAEKGFSTVVPYREMIL